MSTTVSAVRQNYLESIVSTIVEEMRRDPTVFVMGQDLRGGIYGAYPLDEFPERVRSLPISEAANVGAAIGSALTGMRPVLDMTIATFMYSAMDQIVNQAAKSRYLFGGQAKVPLVIRSAMFYGSSQAAHHNDRAYAMFMHTPGLKIILPSTPVNAKGLLRAAIRSDDPVLCFEDANLWGTRAEVPTDPDFLIPLGRAEVRTEGSDVTIVGLANSLRTVMQAVGDLEKEGISAEVIDPRSLVPFDWETVLGSVEKTRRLVVVDPGPLSCGVASEITATVAERLHGRLLAPPRRITGPDVPLAFSPPLERTALPTRELVVETVRHSVAHDAETV
jgi:acetoin:2,6-dichlorophenolindophenol oxidoreductase subunit beta